MYQSDWADHVAPNWLPGCDVESPGYESSVAGPETQESLLTLTLGRLTPTLTLTLSLTLPLTRRAAPSTAACPARPSATAASARTRHGCTPAPRARWRWRIGSPGRPSGSCHRWTARSSSTSCASCSRSRGTRCARARATRAAGGSGPRRSRSRPPGCPLRGNACRTKSRATTGAERCSRSTFSNLNPNPNSGTNPNSNPDPNPDQVLEIDFLYGGAGCTFAPTVSLNPDPNPDSYPDPYP